MTLPSSGPISVSQINQEIGQSSTYSSDLNFLNNLVLPSIRPGTPNMAGFYGLSYFQKNTAGNCNGTGINNCCENCASENCPVVDTSNCNCGCGDQSQNCHVCANCGAINCANCDSQSWLQTGNCNQQPPPTYNCTSFQCYAQACNCSKIICHKLYQLGMMPHDIFYADQKYGNWLRENDPEVYAGYIRWAQVIVDGMEGKSPDFMLWMSKDERKKAEKQKFIKWAHRIATPWSQHMAYIMNIVNRDNDIGRILMRVGRPISRLVGKLPNKNKPVGLLTVYFIWITFAGTYYSAEIYSKIVKLFNNKLFIRKKYNE